MWFDQVSVVNITIPAVLNIQRMNCSDRSYTVTLQCSSPAMVTYSASSFTPWWGQLTEADNRHSSSQSSLHRPGPAAAQRPPHVCSAGRWCTTGCRPTTRWYNFSWSIRGLDSVGAPTGECSSTGLSCRDAQDLLLRLGQQVLDLSLAEGVHWCHQPVTKQRTLRKRSADCTAAVTVKRTQRRLTVSSPRPCRYKNLNPQLCQRRRRWGLCCLHWKMETSGDAKGWKLVTAGSRGGLLPPSASLLLQNGLSTLVVEGELGDLSGEASEPRGSARRKRRVTPCYWGWRPHLLTWPTV